MLPLYLLTSAKSQPILIELKSNETINGNLINCDSWMNLTLSNCIKIDATGEKFTKFPEIYVRGNQIKYLRMSNEIIDQLKENQQNDQNNGKRRGYQNNQQGGRYNNNNNNNNNRRYNQQGGRSNNNNNSNSSGGNRGNYNNSNNSGNNNRGRYGNNHNQQGQAAQQQA